MHNKYFSDIMASYPHHFDEKGFKVFNFKISKKQSEVDFLKRSISMHYQHVYAAQKSKNGMYRLLFFSLSLIFFILTFLIYLKTTNYTGGVFFDQYSSTIKNFINFCCPILGSASFVAGYKIHPEKEAVRHLVKKVENQWQSPAKQLQIEFAAVFSNLNHEQFTSDQILWIKTAFNMRMECKEFYRSEG